ncbi:MAG TPA: acyl-CoA reductase [Stellaceae bacterium]|nr:acyl-CoA reductase [Stellaceae bacterium]
MSQKPIAPLVIRGKVIDSDLVEFGGRGGDLAFLAPDPHKFVSQLPLASPSLLDDLYTLSFEQILEYLEELGALLDVGTNLWLQEARELSYLTAPTTPPLIDGFYATLGAMFDRKRIREWVELSVGVRYLEGWVDVPVGNATLSTRAYGARTVHVIAGNGPTLGALTLIRGAVTRGDTIVKVPSNDPFTTGAIARTMCEFAPDHPITRHFSVGYWRGGDEAFESRLYQPYNVEKIVAWGGFASVKHVTRYIQPGLELISLDPKRSAAVVGGDGLKTEALLEEAAVRIATDVGALNQVACANARVVYVMSGTGPDGLETARKLGRKVYDAMLALPPQISTRPKAYDPELKSHVDALRKASEWHTVFGGKDGEGAVIVSHMAEPVDFFELLADRTVNLIPVDTLDEVLEAVDAYTQTVGVFPDDLLPVVRHRMALHGAQRFVALGYCFGGPGLVGPQDGIEPLRRMCKWIIQETADPAAMPLWARRGSDIAFTA